MSTVRLTNSAVSTDVAEATTTTTKQRSDLRDSDQAECGIDAGRQLGLDHPAFEGIEPPRHRRSSRATSKPTRLADPLLDTFTRRCKAQFSEGTARQYRWGIQSALDLAAEVTRDTFTVADLFDDEEAMSISIATARRVGGGPPLSRWTIASKRAAMRCVAKLLAPELRRLGIVSGLEVIDRALQSRSTRIGMRYSLPGGMTRQRGGTAPDAQTVRALFDAMTSRPGWEGRRDHVFFEILYVTGIRVGALASLDCSNLRRRSDGTGQLVAHAKHGKDSGEFVIPRETMERVDRYVTDFNLWALASARPQRIAVGSEGVLWGSVRGGPMNADAARKALRNACTAIGIEALTPHAFRRAFATTATESLPRATVAVAAGWQGDQRMDDHYVQRSVDSAQRQVGGVHQSRPDSPAPDIPLLPHRPLIEVT
jgi:integrase